MATFGIDLGTTFSCIARYDDKFGKVEIIPNTEAKNTTPSVVYIKDGKDVVVGDTAINQLKGKNAPSVISFAKRLIADDKLCEAGEFPGYPKLNGEQLTPLTASSLILKKLTFNNTNIQGLLNGEAPNVVITFPAYFSQAARARTKQAGEIIGLNIVDMIEEPIAAALSYKVGNTGTPETVMVYDLGGGTFDVTVVNFDGNGRGQVLAKAGNPQLGGFDWDNAFGYYIWQRYNESCPQDIELTPEDFGHPEHLELEKLKKVNAFRLFAQRAKHELTDMPDTEVECDNDGTIVAVTREDFDRETKTLLDTTFGLTNKVLREIGDRKIDKVLLVGGSSFMPQVKNGLETVYPQFSGIIELHEPHLAVAKGAALHAASKVGSAMAGGMRPIEVDNISSKSYGIRSVKTENDRVVGERISILIKKGARLPATIAKTFVTVEEGQTGIDIQVYESDLSADFLELSQGKPLGDESTIKFENRVPRGTPVLVTFKLDDAGLLHVSAQSQVDSGHVEFTLKLVGVMSAAEASQASNLVKDA